jgi:hypothetical protein
VKRHCSGIVFDDNIFADDFIKELIDLHERTSLIAPEPSFLTQPEISDIIYYVATRWVRYANARFATFTAYDNKY